MDDNKYENLALIAEEGNVTIIHQYVQRLLDLEMAKEKAIDKEFDKIVKEKSILEGLLVNSLREYIQLIQNQKDKAKSSCMEKELLTNLLQITNSYNSTLVEVINVCIPNVLIVEAHLVIFQNFRWNLISPSIILF